MQHITARSTLAWGLLALFLAMPSRAQQQNSQQSGSGDPVADAARKAKEQKKDAPKPKKVYTEDDISTTKSDISVVGPAPAPADASGAQTNATAAKSGWSRPTARCSRSSWTPTPNRASSASSSASSASADRQVSPRRLVRPFQRGEPRSDGKNSLPHKGEGE